MQALTRPELAVLLAYAKLTLYGDMLESQVPDDPYLGKELFRYFPEDLLERFPEELQHHRLRREIIATHLTNSIINRGGPSLIARMTDETGARRTRSPRPLPPCATATAWASSMATSMRSTTKSPASCSSIFTPR